MLTFAFPLLTVVSGCANEKELTEICEWVKSPDECKVVGTDDETGGEPSPDHPPCTLSGDGQARTVYQCDGEFSASLSFNTLLGDCTQSLGDASLCTEFHTFGALDESTRCRRSWPAAIPMRHPVKMISSSTVPWT
jgi:hypothetical protein